MQVRNAISILAWMIRYSLFGGNLAYLSMFGKPRKALNYLTTSLFYYQLFANKGLQQRSIYDLFGLDREGVLEVSFSGHNWFDHWQSFVGLDLVYLCVITQLMSPRVIFEIGTFDGISALHFALNSPPDCQVFTLDLPETGAQRPTLRTSYLDRETITQRLSRQVVFRNSSVAGKITQLYGDSAMFDFSPYHGRVDIFFIDGAHSYQYVASDTQSALRCCRKGGIILWHDYGRYGTYRVTHFLNRLAKQYRISRLPGSSLAFHIME